MTKRWMIWVGAILLIALIALFPLRVALGISDLERMGFTARQVAGTIWYGRIGELHLRSQPLGTFEGKLDPTALLLGNVSMRINRMDSPDGVLTGQLIAGFRRGLKDADGRVTVGAMFAPLPVEALELKGATLLFRNGRCAEAGGSVTPLIALPAPGLNLGLDFTGTLECNGDRVRVRSRSASGKEMFEFQADADGGYRAQISVSGATPQAAAALSLLGFRQSARGLTLSTQGRL